MRERIATANAEVEVAVRGRLSPEAQAYAAEKIGKLLRLASEPVLAARVRFTVHHDPAVARPVVVQGNVDVNGRVVRAQVAAPTASEAVDALEARLRTGLERAARHWEARRGRRPLADPREWRHESMPTVRDEFFPRPSEEREILRHKAYTLNRSTVDEAVAEMHLLDYDFHLFTETGTGEDTVVYHAGPTLHRIAQVTPPGPDMLSPFEVPVTISSRRAPLLTTIEAVDRLNLLGRPFLFFLDADRGRGCVLYHRYDGHYGLISPAA
ncbi:ribosome hibernation promotion factor [Amycolatopsis orientalis]|uniref:ribosome hibernation promotion factor n=1 Tax=Amycolatopsis orientalis TaxID=31958 RepID=UPI00041A4131|nr:HPF/RaiA family ribosome-associated protein [Amycolatopsis orientalis]